VTIRAVLIDVDNTMLDRAASVAKFVPIFRSEFAPRLGDVSDKAIAEVIGNIDESGALPRATFLSPLISDLPWRSKPTLGELIPFWTAVYPECAMPMPGLRKTLDAIKAMGLPIGAITNGWGDVQYKKIGMLGVRSYMKSITCAEQAGARKPDVRIFRKALASLGAKPEEAVHIGDNPDADIAGATGAGMTAIWLSGTCEWPKGAAPAKHTINRLEDALGIIKM